jgi:hypothetical protein
VTAGRTWLGGNLLNARPDMERHLSRRKVASHFRLDEQDIRWGDTDVGDFGWVFQSNSWHRIS